MFRRSRLAAVGVLVFATTTLLTGVVSGDVLADQAVVGGNALKVSPVRQDLEMDPGTSKTFTVTIENMTTTPAKLHPIINDFTAGNDEKGEPNILLGEDEYAPTHSLKRYITKVSDFTLGSREIKNITFKITVPKDAAGGGYFGAVRFGAAPHDPTQAKNLSLSASVGSLILVRVNGDIREEMTIKSFNARQKDAIKTFFTSNKDVKAVVRFENGGNVQVAPFGKVVLKKGDKAIAEYEINDKIPRGNVLPDSIRRFEVNLDKVGAFGKYKIEGNFGYGSSGQLLSASKTFYVIPMTLVIAAGTVLVLIVLLAIVLPKMIRSYNRRVIRRASGRR